MIKQIDIERYDTEGFSALTVPHERYFKYAPFGESYTKICLEIESEGFPFSCLHFCYDIDCDNEWNDIKTEEQIFYLLIFNSDLEEISFPDQMNFNELDILINFLNSCIDFINNILSEKIKSELTDKEIENEIEIKSLLDYSLKVIREHKTKRENSINSRLDQLGLS